jgi:acetylcholinesterase
MWRQLPLALFATLSSAEGYNTVKLEGYGSFSGTQVNETYSGHALPHAVDAWLGMDYATQPVGDRRFTQVDRPSPFNGTKAATSFGKVCIQEVLSGHTLDLQDEACLNFNVYRTPGVPLDKKLPVLVWIHGGSMYAGSYQSFDAAAFAASSPEPIVVVNFHYRVNSLGSLPSKLTDEEGLSNLGIKDQRLFLEFVQEHIHAFGGDADAVTVGGRSAGGHSVGIHYFHNYGIDEGKKPLFARAIHQSGSVTARAFAPSDYEIYQTQFREYMDALGCQSNATNSEALECLRAADVDHIRNVTVDIFRKTELDWTWAFQPVASSSRNLAQFPASREHSSTSQPSRRVSQTRPNSGTLASSKPARKSWTTSATLRQPSTKQISPSSRSCTLTQTNSQTRRMSTPLTAPNSTASKPQ